MLLNEQGIMLGTSWRLHPGLASAMYLKMLVSTHRVAYYPGHLALSLLQCIKSDYAFEVRRLCELWNLARPVIQLFLEHLKQHKVTADNAGSYWAEFILASQNSLKIILGKKYEIKHDDVYAVLAGTAVLASAAELVLARIALGASKLSLAGVKSVNEDGISDGEALRRGILSLTSLVE